MSNLSISGHFLVRWHESSRTSSFGAAISPLLASREKIFVCDWHENLVKSPLRERTRGSCSLSPSPDPPAEDSYVAKTSARLHPLRLPALQPPRKRTLRGDDLRRQQLCRPALLP